MVIWSAGSVTPISSIAHVLVGSVPAFMPCTGTVALAMVCLRFVLVRSVKARPKVSVGAVIDGLSIRCEGAEP